MMARAGRLAFLLGAFASCVAGEQRPPVLDDCASADAPCGPPIGVGGGGASGSAGDGGAVDTGVPASDAASDAADASDGGPAGADASGVD